MFGSVAQRPNAVLRGGCWRPVAARVNLVHGLSGALLVEWALVATFFPAVEAAQIGGVDRPRLVVVVCPYVFLLRCPRSRLRLTQTEMSTAGRSSPTVFRTGWTGCFLNASNGFVSRGWFSSIAV